MQKVMFAVPTLSRHPCFEFGMAAATTNFLCLQNQIDTFWRFEGGDPYLSKVRSILASLCLRFHPDVTDFFFLDDDLGWNAEDAVKIIQRPEDIVFGVYPKKNDKRQFPVEVLEENGQVYTRDGMFKASLAPTGFMRIKRYVLERCAEESGQYPHLNSDGEEILVWDIFRTGFGSFEPNGKFGRWWGEDFLFSVMVRDLGFEMWFDPKMVFSHRGTKAWVDSFDEGLQAWVKTLPKPPKEI